MKSGSQSGSRFGIKGAEDVGNGLKVGFQLENGFDADTGSLGYNSRLFGREARVYLSGDFGEVAFGRMGTLGSGNGTYGLLGGMTPLWHFVGRFGGKRHLFRRQRSCRQYGDL